MSRLAKISRSTASSYNTTVHTTRDSRVQQHNTSQHEFPNSRPAKRRRLEIRGPKQQTLDCFFGLNAIIRAPVKIDLQVSNGPAVSSSKDSENETTVKSNGVAVTATETTLPPAKKLKHTPQKQQEKRTLRSQDDGPRLKSELATYFGSYEDIMFDAPREVEFINVDSSLYITDDGAAKVAKPSTPSPSKSTKSARTTPKQVREIISPAEPPIPNRMEVDLSSIMKSIRDDVDDPLTEDVFMVSHRRAERKEKQMRNIEKEHAMHEKVQLDRLLEGLQGHDWVKVLGVTGVTDGEAKKFESKREYFIAEVEALIEKFDAWKEEEKRQRMEREAILAAEREEEEDEADNDENGEASSDTSSVPASNDLSMSASRQLQQEAAMAFAKAKKKEKEKLPPPPPPPYRPPSPISSFYSSKHLRESTLKKARNSRTLLAFGLPLPEVDEHDFVLPAEYLTQDVLNASARERRRRQRENIANAGKGRPP